MVSALFCWFTLLETFVGWRYAVYLLFVMDCGVVWLFLFVSSAFVGFCLFDSLTVCTFSLLLTCGVLLMFVVLVGFCFLLVVLRFC